MTFLALGSNTVHILLPELQSQSRMPFMSMIKLVSDQVITDRINRIGIVSSSMTRTKKLYSHPLTEAGMKVILPSPDQQLIVDQVIRAVLAGQLNRNLQRKYQKTLAKLLNSGAQAIILGCTELPLALGYEELGIPSYNCVRILARGITDQYYKNLNLQKVI